MARKKAPAPPPAPPKSKGKTAKKPAKKKGAASAPPPPAPPKAPAKKKHGFFRTLFKWGFVLGIWGLIALILLLGWYGAELPSITQKADFVRRSTIIIKAADGSIIGRYGDLKGNTVSLQDLPPHLPHAVIAIEDRRFYSHPGIDPIGLVRALAQNLLKGGVRQGGSTITQQLAKNLFLSHERTLKRKIQEAMLALWLEHELSKDEILSAYLNRVYLGSGAYGVDAAARRYFDKPASDVSLQEAAVLAGLLKAPSHYSPLHAPKAAYKRAQIVLQAMVREGFITQTQAENAKNVMVTSGIAQPLSQNRARYFTDWVISALDDLIGDSNDDLVIETTLEPALQNVAEASLVTLIQDFETNKHVSQGAVLMMAPYGAVLAMVGGKDYSASQFNRVTQARRQPGSAFKPLVFLTAIEQGWRGSDMLQDAPFEASAAYRPQNFGQHYYGEVSLDSALTKSLNTASVRLMQASGGPKATIKTASKLGVRAPLEADLSLALGSGALSLQELTSAYASFANGGQLVVPYAITRITGADDVLYYNRNRRPNHAQIIKRSSARLLTTMLEHVVESGTGHRAALEGVKAAGKTGTSQDYRDAWFIGFADDLVTGIWLGNDDNSPMEGVTGGSLPATLWHSVMAQSIPLYQARERGAAADHSFGKLLERLLPSAPESIRPDYSNLNE